MDRLIGNVAGELWEMEQEMGLMAKRLVRLRKMLEESQTPELPGADRPAESAERRDGPADGK